MMPIFLDFELSEEEGDIETIPLPECFIEKKLSNNNQIYFTSDASINNLVNSIIELLSSYNYDKEIMYKDNDMIFRNYNDSEQFIKEIFKKRGFERCSSESLRNEHLLGKQNNLRARDLLVLTIDIENYLGITLQESDFLENKLISFSSIVNLCDNYIKKGGVINESFGKEKL